MLQRIPIPVRVLVCLLIFGMLRSPLEDFLRRRMTMSGMLLPVPGQTGIQQLGQSALMGTLGGLRSLVASYLVLESYHHFSEENWDENRRALVMATYLEPNEETHWVDLVWHRGINATAWVETRSGLPELERRLRYNEYTLDAIELGNAGLEQLPDSVALRLQLAEVYKEKLKDYCGASRLFGELMRIEGAPTFVKRFYGYYLASCPGKEREAYDHLYQLYWEGPQHHLPGLIKRVLTLQEKLEVPMPLWIREEDPDKRGLLQPRRMQKRPPLPGGISIP